MRQSSLTPGPIEQYGRIVNSFYQIPSAPATPRFVERRLIVIRVRAADDGRWDPLVRRPAGAPPCHHATTASPSSLGPAAGSAGRSCSAWPAPAGTSSSPPRASSPPKNCPAAFTALPP